MNNYEPLETGLTDAPRRRLLVPVLLALLFFLLGLAAMVAVLTRWDAAARFVGIAPEPAPVVPAPVATPAPQPELPQAPNGTTAGTTPERIVIDPEITRRVALLEQRIGQVANQSRSAVGNADRAEGLLVAFAARRALDRGIALGFLEALLSQRFGDTQPQAVGTIIAAARQPVTLQELQEGLQEVGPDLTGPGPQESWWGSLRAEFGNLVTVRRAGTPSPEPRERLRRATRWLESGEVAPALAEVLRMPGRESAGDWVVKARRYVMARRALDTIETAALLEPRQAPAQPAPPPAAPTQQTPATAQLPPPAE